MMKVAINVTASVHLRDLLHIVVTLRGWSNAAVDRRRPCPTLSRQVFGFRRATTRTETGLGSHGGCADTIPFFIQSAYPIARTVRSYVPEPTPIGIPKEEAALSFITLPA